MCQRRADRTCWMMQTAYMFLLRVAHAPDRLVPEKRQLCLPIKKLLHMGL